MSLLRGKEAVDSDIEIRGEMEKFFPAVACRHVGRSCKEIEVYGSKTSSQCDADFRRLGLKDLWMCFGKKGSPFGDISDPHSKVMPTYEEIRWSVAMITDVVLTQDIMTSRKKIERRPFPISQGHCAQDQGWSEQTTVADSFGLREGL